MDITVDTVDVPILFTYQWNIKNFHSISSSTIVSPDFGLEVDNVIRAKFNFYLFPYGRACNPHYVSVAAQMRESSRPEVKMNIGAAILVFDSKLMNYQVLVRNVNPAKFIHGQDCDFPIDMNLFGGEKFIERARLDRSPWFFLGGTLKLVFKVDILRVSGPSDEIPIPESHHFKKFWSFVKGRKHTDTTIQVGKRTFHVHKMVLAASSPVFAAMFEHNMQEANQNHIQISDCSPEAVDAMLKFIYGVGNHCVSGMDEKGIPFCEQVLDVMTCADKYDISALKTRCEIVLAEQLSNAVVLQVLQKADLHGAHFLKRKAIDYIRQNIREVANSEAWASLPTALVGEVLCAMADMINALQRCHK